MLIIILIIFSAFTSIWWPFMPLHSHFPPSDSYGTTLHYDPKSRSMKENAFKVLFNLKYKFKSKFVVRIFPGKNKSRFDSPATSEMAKANDAT